MTPLFQFVDKQLPTFGPLPASVNETIRGHDSEHNCSQNDAVRQAQDNKGKPEVRINHEDGTALVHPQICADFAD